MTPGGTTHGLTQKVKACWTINLAVLEVLWWSLPIT